MFLRSLIRDKLKRNRLARLTSRPSVPSRDAPIHAILPLKARFPHPGVHEIL